MSDYLVHLEGAGLFHDFEVGDIAVDYRNKYVVLQLKSPSLPVLVYELKLFGVRRFHVGMEEPWGKGNYVVGTDIEREGSVSSDAIRAFWGNHLPICLSVKGGYGYYAIRLSDSVVVHGTEPEFEETRKATPSFGRFLEMICNGELVLDV